jgi:hypothetical protein
MGACLWRRARGAGLASPRTWSVMVTTARLRATKGSTKLRLGSTMSYVMPPPPRSNTTVSPLSVSTSGSAASVSFTSAAPGVVPVVP